MESVTPPLTETTPRIIYTVYTRAETVELRGLDPNKAWWVRFDGSWESLHFGLTKPFEEGDLVKITFEKVVQYK